MKHPFLFRTSLITALVSAVCCFTPLLVIVLGALGLAASLVWVDYIFLPALIISLFTLGYLLWKRAYVK